MLTIYADVFSGGKASIEQRTLMEHEIPVYQETEPIWLLLWRPTSEKDREVEDQVRHQVKQGLIEPGD